MNTQNNDDFKYVIQDTSCVYFGRELTYTEMMDKEDVPFKWKAIISAYIKKDTDLNVKMTDHLLELSPEAFSYRIFEQVKLTVRICYQTQTKGFGKTIKNKWIHKAVPLKNFCSAYSNSVKEGSVMIEDISISKLALMVVSI